jgi:hypothetical protein
MTALLLAALTGQLRSFGIKNPVIFRAYLLSRRQLARKLFHLPARSRFQLNFDLEDSTWQLSRLTNRAGASSSVWDSLSRKKSFSCRAQRIGELQAANGIRARSTTCSRRQPRKQAQRFEVIAETNTSIRNSAVRENWCTQIFSRPPNNFLTAQESHDFGFWPGGGRPIRQFADVFVLRD